MLGGPLTEWIIQKKWLSRTHTRKLFAFICNKLVGPFKFIHLIYFILANFGVGLCYACVPFAGCNEVAVLLLLVGSELLGGLHSGSETPVPAELSKNFPATLFA